MFLPFNEEFFTRKNLITKKKIGWGLVVTVALWGGVCNLSRPVYIANKIYDIENRTFCDTVVRVFYDKDDYGPFTATRFKGDDTPYCFNGTQLNKRMLYSEFVKPGDVVIKKRKAETFFVKRKDSIVEFDLSLCSQYADSSNQKLQK